MIKKYKKDLFFLGIIFFFSIIVCNGFVRMHYTADTYNILDMGYGNYAINYFLKDGRIFSFLLFNIAEFFKIPLNVMNYISEILSILVSCISVIILSKIIKRIKPIQNKKDEIIVDLIAYLTIFNFMYIETLYFLETVIITLSIMFYTIAVKNIIFENKNYIIKSIIFCFLGILCYQGTLSFFMILGVAMCIIKERDFTKKLIKKILIIGLIAIFVAVFDIIMVKSISDIFQINQNRINIMQIKENIKVIIYNSGKIIWSTCDALPAGVFLGMLIGIIGYAGIYSIRKKEMDCIENIILIIGATIILSFAVFMITKSSFFCSRMYVRNGCISDVINSIFLL